MKGGIGKDGRIEEAGRGGKGEKENREKRSRKGA